MLTRIRNKARTVSLIAMWLIAMATIFVSPVACAMADSCGKSSPAADMLRPSGDAQESASCHASKPAAEAEKHCGMGGPCCPRSDDAGSAESSRSTGTTPGIAADLQSEGCHTEFSNPTDTATSGVALTSLDLHAAILPAPAPWIYLATHSSPFTSAPLLSCRDVSARPQSSRAPPYLA